MSPSLQTVRHTSASRRPTAAWRARRASARELPVWAAVLGADPAEVPAVRGDVRALAVATGFGERADDVELVVDELLANAQEHGRPPVAVRAWCDGRLVIEVVDRGPGFDRHRVWRAHPPAPDAHRGRGLWIARQLTDLVAVGADGRGAWVRVELCPDPHIGA